MPDCRTAGRLGGLGIVTVVPQCWQLAGSKLPRRINKKCLQKRACNIILLHIAYVTFINKYIYIYVPDSSDYMYVYPLVS